MRDLVAQQEEYIISMRRAFHTHPEVSGQEFDTRDLLIRELEGMGVPYQKVPGTGLVAVIQGARPGKNRLLRADIDALPLQEDENNLKGPKTCVSARPGVCHACGHDAHMAMLLGTMRVLLQLREQLCGTVYCCFEEGEETNCGIDAMMEALKAYPVEECFALHVYNNPEGFTGFFEVEPWVREFAAMNGIPVYGSYHAGRVGIQESMFFDGLHCKPEALRLIKAWGFQYKSVAFVWLKKNRKADSWFYGLGFWTRGNAEICLLATKGHPKRQAANIHQFIISPIEAHSKKPDEAREKIVALMGDLPRVELFARQTPPGWDVWGNEVESTVPDFGTNCPEVSGARKEVSQGG